MRWQLIFIAYNTKKTPLMANFGCYRAFSMREITQSTTKGPPKRPFFFAIPAPQRPKHAENSTKSAENSTKKTHKTAVFLSH